MDGTKSSGLSIANLKYLSVFIGRAEINGGRAEFYSENNHDLYIWLSNNIGNTIGLSGRYYLIQYVTYNFESQSGDYIYIARCEVIVL